MQHSPVKMKMSGKWVLDGVWSESFLIAAGYFLVLFAYFKTETLFIQGSFSLSVRHSSESFPAHHLFYNEPHHSYVLWVPIEFTEFSLCQGLDQKLPNFLLQLALSLFSTDHNVDVLKNQAIHQSCCATFCINYYL